MTAYVRPATTAAALDARTAHPNWLVLAGGTDAMLDAHARLAPGVIDVFGIDELHGVEVTAGVVRIGACTTYAELLADPTIGEVLSMLRDAAADVGAVQVRNRGTIGGNVVTASPVGDVLPVLLALDACVDLADPSGRRTIPFEWFVTGFRRVDLRSRELLVAVEVPVPAPGTVQVWHKVGTRAAQAITKVSLACAARLDHGLVAHARFACGGVADRPVRLHRVEDLVLGAQPGPALAAAARDAVVDSIDPITDVRSTADYRRDVAANLVTRFVTGLASGLDAGAVT